MSELLENTLLSDEDTTNRETDNVMVDNATEEPSVEAEEAPEPIVPSEPTPEEELTRLREEVGQLRQALSQKEAAEAKTMRELGEFHRLFPDVSVKQVPRQVWEQVEGGLPLSAAYALYEREIQLSALRAEKINRRNAARSSGKAGKNAPAEYYSPDEVRAMSQKQVHDNYAVIVESMKRWH